MSNESIVHLSDINNVPFRVIVLDDGEYVSVNDIKTAIGYNGGGHTFLSACAMQKMQFEGKGRASYFVKASELHKAHAKNGSQAPFQVICDYFTPIPPPPETNVAKENVNTMPDERVQELFGNHKEIDLPVEIVLELESEPVEPTEYAAKGMLTDLQAEIVRLQARVDQELNRLRNYYRYADIDGDTLEITPIPGGGGIRIAHLDGSDAVDFTDREEVGHLVNNINAIFEASIN